MLQYQRWDHHSVLFLTHYVCRTILKTETQNRGF